jgi:hypothetical protein
MFSWMTRHGLAPFSFARDAVMPSVNPASVMFWRSASRIFGSPPACAGLELGQRQFQFFDAARPTPDFFFGSALTVYDVSDLNSIHQRQSVKLILWRLNIR